MTSATYVYAVVKSASPPTLARVPPGMPGGALPRAIRVSRPPHTWLIVSDVPADVYTAEAINANLRNLDWVTARALAHEAVVEYCAARLDVVPMKLFTIFRDDARAVKHVGDPARLSRVFRRIAGCAEWSVRLSCSSPAAGPTPRRAGRRTAAESGSAFLQRKKAQRDDVRRAAEDAARVVDETYRTLATAAKGAVRKDGDIPGSALLLDAAFLVVRTKQKAFTGRVKQLALSAGKAGCEVVLSGPWPAYHFVSGD